jgi:hypothetical protein
MHSEKFSPWESKDEQRHGESRMRSGNGALFIAGFPAVCCPFKGGRQASKPRWQMTIGMALWSVKKWKRHFTAYRQGLGECFPEDVNHQRGRLSQESRFSITVSV